MKRFVLSIATAGLLLSAGAAYSQNTQTQQKDTPAQTTQSGNGQTSQTGQGQNSSSTQRSGASTQTGERREGARRSERGERRGERTERREGGERMGLNIRVGGDRDGYRHHRRGYGYAQYGARCRTVIVKSFRHGHRIVKRIRRCR